MGDLEDLVFKKNIPGRYSGWEEDDDDRRGDEEDGNEEDNEIEDPQSSLDRYAAQKVFTLSIFIVLEKD
jgi:hypothetical protein